MKHILYLALFSLALSASAARPTLQQADSMARATLAVMTIDDKFTLIEGSGYDIRPIERLGIKRLRMYDGPMGLRDLAVGMSWYPSPRDGYDSSRVAPVNSTAYPAPVMLAATWNRALAHDYGYALGRDSRARGINIILGPGVNIYRSPLNARNFEYLGEDPYLASVVSGHYIIGVQENPGVIACVKHFAANNPETGRNYVSSDVDERTLHEIYFPAFKNAVECGVGSLMSSYNRLNGTWTAENRWLMHDVLRDAWHFPFMSMTDWDAAHHTTLMVRDGVDIEMPGKVAMTPDRIRPLLESGAIDGSYIDDKVLNILRTAYYFQLYDYSLPDMSIPLDDPQSAAVAYNVAAEGLVLLKNDNRLLPVSPDVRSICVVGHNARHYVTGGGSSIVTPFRTQSLFDALASECATRNIKLDFVEMPDSTSLSGYDLIIAAEGFNHATESEGADRPFALPDDREQVLRTVAQSSVPAVAIVNAGGNIDSNGWHDGIDALVWAWYGGQEGNRAIVDMLFGTVNPSGKLPMTFERLAADNPSAATYSDEGDKHVVWTEGIFTGYRGYERNGVTPLYPFGYGLSYTDFAFSDLDVAYDTATGDIKVAVTVTNTGNCAGSEVAQLYVGKAEPSQVRRAAKELKSFDKLNLAPGESKRATLDIHSDGLRYYDVNTHTWVDDPGVYNIMVGNSVANLPLMQQLTIPATPSESTLDAYNLPQF